ncbi:MAG: AAA family ATPase [Nanoarchaeota archaeon]|nr:AAA family ATPase [Nanoarchaeota archaeon]
MGKSVGILSLKGGVGKTSTVVALGQALADFGKSVLLVDANFSAPNLGMHLNIIDPETTLHHVLERTANILDAIYVVGKLHVLPASLFGDEVKNPLALKDKLKNLKRKYDYILIDSAPALNEESLAATLASDEAFVVTTPDYPTLSTTIKAIKAAAQRGTKINGLILNKVYGKNFELSLKDIENTAEVPVLAVIPHDKDFTRALSEFKPYPLVKPNSEGTSEFRKLAATMIGVKYKPFSIKEFFTTLTPPKQEINREIFYRQIFNENQQTQSPN